MALCHSGLTVRAFRVFCFKGHRGQAPNGANQRAPTGVTAWAQISFQFSPPPLALPPPGHTAANTPTDIAFQVIASHTLSNLSDVFRGPCTTPPSLSP
jgi:hypothetical protein